MDRFQRKKQIQIEKNGEVDIDLEIKIEEESIVEDSKAKFNQRRERTMCKIQTNNQTENRQNSAQYICNNQK